MIEADYGMTRSLGEIDFERAVERVTGALKNEGFGVITAIDVKATLKEKLGVDRRPYTILGACNPPIAHEAIEAEPLIGLLLPCNVVVMEEEDQTITVSIADPLELFKMVGRPDMEATMMKVRDIMLRVRDAL